MDGIDTMYKTIKHGEKARRAAREMNSEACWGWTILVFLGLTLLIMCLL